MEDRAERKNLGIRVEYRRRGEKSSRGDLVDLSRTGFQMDSSASFSVGDMIWLHLPGLAAQEARVMRVDGFRIGCAFTNPVADYVFDNWLERSGFLKDPEGPK